MERQKRIIDQTKQTVNLLPIFEEKIINTNLVSSNVVLLTMM